MNRLESAIQSLGWPIGRIDRHCTHRRKWSALSLLIVASRSRIDIESETAAPFRQHNVIES